MMRENECQGRKHCHRDAGHAGSCEYGPYLAVGDGDGLTMFVGPGGVCNICGEDWPLGV